MSGMFRSGLYLSSLLLLLVVGDEAEACMIAEFLSTTFILNETCYWELQPVSFTTWQSAETACDKFGGRIADIPDYHDLEEIGLQLQRQAYIRRYNGSAKSGVVNENGVTLEQMILLRSGEIQTQDVNPDDILETSVLCSTGMTDLLCPEISAANTIGSLSAPHYLGDSVSFTCLDKFSLYGNTNAIQTVTCVAGQDGLEWNTDLLECKPLLCSEPPPVLGNGTFSPLQYGLGVQLTYTCLQGWLFRDENRTMKFTCNETTGTWEPQAVIDQLICIEEVCLENITLGENSFSGPLQNRVGSSTVFWCDDGFRLRTGAYKVEVKCSIGIQPVPTWSMGTTPKCYSNLCPRLDVNDASLLGDYEEAVEVGQVVIYMCNGNTLFPGGEINYQMTCLETGEWNREPALSGCDETQCLDGWYRSLSGCYYASEVARRYDSAVELCEEKNSYLITVSSEDEKNRVTKQLYDDRGVDYWIGYYKKNMTWQWIEGLSNYTNFAVGYPELHECIRTTADGYWKDRDCMDFMHYICEKPAVCGEPPTVKNAQLLSSLSYPIDVGAVVQYKCNYRYNLPDGRTSFNSTCQVGGTWSWVSNCIKTRCKALNRQEMQVEFAMVDTDNNLFTSVVSYECINGYIFPDGKNVKRIECLEDGQWTPLPPSCIKIQCPPSLTENSVSDSVGDNSYGMMKLFRCAEGYYFKDGMSERVFRCNNRAQWVPGGDEQLCLARRCPKYYEENAEISTDDVRYPNSVTVTCHKSYRYPDGNSSKTVRCNIAGTWNSSSTSCGLVTCPGPTPPPIENSIRNSNSIKAGAIITYTCTAGYTFPKQISTKDVYCDETTLKWTWRGDTETPECITWKELKDSYLYVYPDQLLVLIVERFAIGYQALFILVGLIYLLLIAVVGKRQVAKHFDIVISDISSVSMINYEEKVEGDGGNLSQTEPQKQKTGFDPETYEEAEEPAFVGEPEGGQTPPPMIVDGESGSVSAGEQKHVTTAGLLEEPGQEKQKKRRPKAKKQRARTKSEISLGLVSAVYGGTSGFKLNRRASEKKLKKQLTKSSLCSDLAGQTPDTGVIPEDAEP